MPPRRARAACCGPPLVAADGIEPPTTDGGPYFFGGLALRALTSASSFSGPDSVSRSVHCPEFASGSSGADGQDSVVVRSETRLIVQDAFWVPSRPSLPARDSNPAPPDSTGARSPELASIETAIIRQTAIIEISRGRPWQGSC